MTTKTYIALEAFIALFVGLGILWLPILAAAWR